MIKLTSKSWPLSEGSASIISAAGFQRAWTPRRETQVLGVSKGLFPIRNLHHREKHLRTKDAKFNVMGKRQMLHSNRLSETSVHPPLPKFLLTFSALSGGNGLVPRDCLVGKGYCCLLYGSFRAEFKRLHRNVSKYCQVYLRPHPG